ncbi:carbamoyl-phosphate synthase large subunit [Cohnella sp. OV330]|uniref:ATP-grasp domain-containing protein n=1 Tax=Cohnella sp. OV330 TaxID=1855288 RepID=UPI0008E11A8F|nr:carbamoyl-phosphate synthase large subunit [Cohnella sp. OV330]
MIYKDRSGSQPLSGGPTALFTSVGRRVQLVRHFAEAGWRVIGADLNPADCAAQVICSKVHAVPPCSAGQRYYDRLLEICRLEQIDYLIPLYEPELIGLAGRQRDFQDSGTTVIVSQASSLELCLNKFRLFQFLRSHEFDTPDTYLEPDKIDHTERKGSRWVVKPVTGMGSKNIHIVSPDELCAAYGQVKSPLIQRFVHGQEYSIDAYVDQAGNVRSVVPRKRLVVRSGEVSKSITVEDEAVTRETVRLLAALQLYGPVTVQGIKESDTGRFYFIEVNPRFGGGVPLSMRAGIPYAEWIADRNCDWNGTLQPYQTGLKMLRYDEALFVED